MDREAARAASGAEENLSGPERLGSLALGGGLLGYALMKRGAGAKLLAIPALILVSRGWRGHSTLYGMLGVSTLHAGRPEERESGVEGGRQSSPAAGRADRGEPEGRARAEEAGAPPGEWHAEPGEDSPHPTPPRSHRHDVPENELGEPGVRATPKLMDEVSTTPPPG